MATVCGGVLALMDAGVPIARPVAGIAMGLVVEGDGKVLLSDIVGDEDHLGDMDFKVAGTSVGVTALQLDNKLGSVTREVLAEALERAARGRAHILEKMAAISAAPRPEPPPHAPRVVVLQIRPARIRDLIGPGGRHIQDIQRDSGVKIDVDENGRVRIQGPAGARVREATRRVRHFTGEPTVGRVYRGEVTGVTDFGCFVQIFHGIEGLVHVTDLAREHVAHPSDVASMGAEMIVRVLGVTKEGRLRLSRREALDAGPEEIEE
jgi:polyribonucleotide nucleotidyltransferase